MAVTSTDAVDGSENEMNDAADARVPLLTLSVVRVMILRLRS